VVSHRYEQAVEVRTAEPRVVAVNRLCDLAGFRTEPAANRLYLPGNLDAEDLMFSAAATLRLARENRGLPRMECQSTALTDIASTFTRTSPASGAGLTTPPSEASPAARTSRR